MECLKKFSLAILLLGLLWDGAWAQDGLCDVPPYGDTQGNYAKLHEEFLQTAAKRPELPPGVLMEQLEKAFSVACKAKYLHGDRTAFLRSGLKDEDIDRTPPSGLIKTWFNYLYESASKTAAPPSHQEDGTRIYALFQCVRETQTCQMQGAPRIALGELMPGMYFRSADECVQSIQHMGIVRPPVDGRYMLTDSIWYECRSKRIDTWDAAQ